MTTKDRVGRAGSPVRAHHYSPSLSSAHSFSVSSTRDRSPHIAMDRVTRHVSPGRHRSMRNECIREVTPRVTQPYKTSFSAVTSPKVTMAPISAADHRGSNSTTVHPLGLNRGGPASTTTVSGSPALKSGRAKSHDTATRSRDPGWRKDNNNSIEDDENNRENKERALSCDMLDGPIGGQMKQSNPTVQPYNASLVGSGVGAFDNRRLNPKYSSTPTRLAKSPYASNDLGVDKYSRMDSNVSADTLDSVFTGGSADQSFGSGNSSGQCQYGKDNNNVQVAEMEGVSKTPDLGYTEGCVELSKCLEVEYVHIVDLTYEKLLKDKKKKRLPAPNEETAQLVSEMMSRYENRFHDKPDSCPSTPQHNGSSSKKTAGKSTLSKKSLSSSITNFFRKMAHSPKMSKKTAKKKGSKRSKSAGRLEGNRSVLGDSSSELGYREISMDYSSMSSDTRGSVDGTAQDVNASHVNSRGNPRNAPASASILEDTDTKENTILNDPEGQRSYPQSHGRRSRKEASQNSGQGGSRQELGSSSTRVYLKSIEDNAMTNRNDEKTVYKSFKEKQSPGYRRHTEAVSMRSQALKAVEISERGNLPGSGERRSSGSTATGPTSPLVIDSTYYKVSDFSSQISEAKRVEDLNEVNRQAAFFGNQSKEESLTETEDGDQSNSQDTTTHDSGSESSLSHSGNLLQEPHTSHNASPKSHDNSGHLQNGSLTEVHSQKDIDQQKSPSYVKLSCSVSGYQKYPKSSLPKVSPTAPAPAKDVATNNNTPQPNGNPQKDMTVPAEYIPGGSNFVKGLSQKFEAYSHPKDGDASAKAGHKNKSSRTDRDQKDGNNSKQQQQQQPGNSFVHKVNSVSPQHHNSGATHRNRSSPSPAKDVQIHAVTAGDSDQAVTVDADNIDFKRARRAFSRGSSGGIQQPAEPIASTKPKKSSSSSSVSTSVGTSVPVITSAKGLSHSNEAFDSVEAGGANTTTTRTSLLLRASSTDAEEGSSGHNNNLDTTELHLDLNGAGRQNGIDETDDSVFHRDLNASDIVVGCSSLSKPLLLNGDISLGEVTTPSHIRMTSETHRECSNGENHSLEQRNESLEILANQEVGSSASLSSDHQAAGSTGTLNSNSSSVPSKDGKYFLAVVESEEKRLNDHVTRTESYMKNCVSEEVMGKMRAAIGKANLLTSKKFKQFRGLCHQNITQSSDEQFTTTAQDLAGFWDMVMIQVDDVYSLFSEIEKIRQNGWTLESKKTPEMQKSVPSTPAKSAAGKKSTSSAKGTPRSAKAQQASKAREEARRRLLEAKKAGRHMRKASENEDVEIFIA